MIRLVENDPNKQSKENFLIFMHTTMIAVEIENKNNKLKRSVQSINNKKSKTNIIY